MLTLPLANLFRVIHSCTIWEIPIFTRILIMRPSNYLTPNYSQHEILYLSQLKNPVPSQNEITSVWLYLINSISHIAIVSMMHFPARSISHTVRLTATELEKWRFLHEISDANGFASRLRQPLRRRVCMQSYSNLWLFAMRLFNAKLFYWQTANALQMSGCEQIQFGHCKVVEMRKGLQGSARCFPTLCCLRGTALRKEGL